MESFDVVVVGAGAAGLFCAGIAGQRRLRVLLLDHSSKLAEKIRISGGGRCNFTNRQTQAQNFLSDNPAFCRSALARYTPQDFIGLVQRHSIPFHEKHKGQLFCDRSSEQIINMLVAECEAGGVVRRQPCTVQDVLPKMDGGFLLQTTHGPVRSRNLVVATGGLPIPKIGASDWGLRLAERLGHRLVEPRPALVPLTFDPEKWAPYVGLAGLSLPVEVSTGKGKARGSFQEDLLFTHRGLSGPAVLQISSYRVADDPIELNLLPGTNIGEALVEAKRLSRRQLANELATHLPQRLAQAWLAHDGLDGSRPLPECRERDLQMLGEGLHRWVVQPTGDEGWRRPRSCAVASTPVN